MSDFVPKRSKKAEKCCSTQLALVFMLVVVLCACVGVLAVYTYSLRTKLLSLESRLETYHMQLEKLDLHTVHTTHSPASSGNYWLLNNLHNHDICAPQCNHFLIIM